MQGAGLTFARQAIPAWEGIWLASASPLYDIVGGGITILDARRYDEAGDEQITFTSGHVSFRQSLLVRADDVDRLDSYDKLTSAVTIGVLPYSTGETRLLQITGYVDADGVLAPGVTVVTPDGQIVADGSADFFITPAGESPAFASRTALETPNESMPHVRYLGGEAGESELIEALYNGEVDGLARGMLGNLAAAFASDGGLVVTAADHKIERGGFTLDVDDSELAACLDEKINWLTLDGTIGYLEWLTAPDIFMERAQLWNEARLNT